MPDPSILNLKGKIGNSTELDAIANPSFQRLGMFVRDIEATTKELSSIWGIDSWETLEFTPPQSAMRVGSAFKVKLARANLLGLSFHIYAPVDDLDTFAKSSPVWGRFLKRSTGGIQHICVSVDNWEEVVAKVVERGGKVYKTGSYDGMRWAHVDCEVGNCVVAIEERTQLAAPIEKAVGVSKVKGRVGNSKELDAIANPSLQHIGIYVKDLGAFMRCVTKVWGVDEWETLEFAPPQDTMKAGKAFRLYMANANLLGVLLHVSQRAEDLDTFGKAVPIWAQYERTAGEGLYHVCISVDNWERVVDTVKARGANLFASSSYEGRRWAHFYCAVSGLNVEIEERPKPKAKAPTP
jgi:catechol 2,3-dioxygenase-like lactoylglutathione lyase family enzyme